MERVGVLIEKLQEQYKQNADAKQLLMTVQMLMKELNSLPVNGANKTVSVIFPTNHFFSTDNTKEEIAPEVLHEIIHDKIEVKTETKVEPVTESKQQIPSGFLNKWYGDPIKDIPTLAHQSKEMSATELNEAIAKSNADGSLNEKLRIEKIEIQSVLQDSPIKDLKKAIGLNERYLFINELFKGDETTYERSIKTINDFKIFAEAEYWIKRELKLKYAWSDGNETVKQFDQLVKRRFS
jgi:hypothetical protein